MSDDTNQPIYVTQPNLAPLKEFIPYLEQIWANKILTNGGPFHQQLEAALCIHLGVRHLSLFTNATIGLVTALQALKVSGEVITTPFSFVATSHSLLWNGIKPVFVDIDPVTLNLDPTLIENAVTARTTAIMPVHVYGYPCDVEKIKKVADKFKLKIIYDAAHAFGVTDAGGSVLRHGDISVLSFHATKVFNTFEGGAIISPDMQTKQRVDHLKNFGFVDEVTVIEPGINGKMSELNASFGLLQLNYIKEALAGRERIDKIYREHLGVLPGIKCVSKWQGGESNYSYFPILVGPHFKLSRDGLYQKMRDNNVFPRRYFYPLISDFPMYKDLESAQAKNLPVAREIANQILCLPIYPAMSNSQVMKIINLVTG